MTTRNPSFQGDPLGLDERLEDVESRTIDDLNSESEKKNEDFPEGGLWGWLAVLGGFCLSVSTFGLINSWGTFQAYYEELNIASPSAIAWIGSLQFSLIFLPGIVAGRLFDYGYFRQCLIVSTALFTASNFLIAECHTYWQIILCQGVALGLACGLSYVPCIAVVSQYYKRRRPIAFSLISIGISVGGIIYPIIFRNLLPSVGFKWTIRTIAFINVFMFTVAHLTMFPRLPPSKGSRGWIDVNDFRAMRFSFFVLSTFVAFLGMYTMLTYLSVSSLAIGASTSLAFYIVSIANASGAIGRLFGGILAVKHGVLNIMIIFTSITAVCTYIWPFVTSISGFIVLTCFYGFSSGVFVGLFALGAATMGDITSVGRRTGEQMTVMAIGALFGPPISGAIFDDAHTFKPVGVYAGSTIVLSVLLLIAARYVTVQKLLGGKV